MAGSNISVVNSSGVGTVPLSTPAPDANGNVAPHHLAGYVENGIATPVSAAKPLPVTPILPTFAFTATSTAASSLVLKASAGVLYSAYVSTGNVGGWLMLFNAASAPADGTVTPIDALYCPANSTATIDYASTPQAFGTGLVAVFSSTGPFTKTASATAFLKGCVA